MKFVAPEKFSTDHFSQSGCFAHLAELTDLAKSDDFPDLDALNSWLSPDTKTTTGKPIRFIPQPNADELAIGWSYEAHIATTGQVPTRHRNWHDLFGAAMWCLFPKTKAIFNHWHFHDLQAKQTAEHQKLRSQRRHVITALDECGLILVSRNSSVINALQHHEWIEGFWENRTAWERDIGVYMIGHANYEMMTRPFIGLTGKAWHVPMPDSFFALGLSAQYQMLDSQIADYLYHSEMRTVKEQLFPLPLLGIPSWSNNNEALAFYKNEEYFRPSRGRVVASWDGD